MSRFRFQATFLALSALLPSAFRVWLWAERHAELSDLSGRGTLFMLWMGMRFDLVIAAELTFLAGVGLLLSPERWLRGAVITTRVWSFLVFLLIAGAELAGLHFFAFYDFRPNYIVLDHAADPEVMRTVVSAYPIVSVAAGTVLLAAAMTWLLARLAPLPSPGEGSPWRDRMAMLGVLAFTAFAVRGTFDHRPLNPSAATFSSNRLANEVAGSGLYNVTYEAVQRFRGRYGRVEDCIEPLADDEALAAARDHLQSTGRFVSDGPNPLVRVVHGSDAATTRPRNVVVVVLESYTGRLIGHLGGEPALSPELDALAENGLALTRCFATGERTVQGLEAVLSSFPPMPGVAVIRRPETHAGFDTLATVLRRAGYATSFVYGGQGLFDQMLGFFQTNGYDRFIEEKDFDEPRFTSNWGVSDDDLYGRVIREARESHDAGRPFLVTALTISLHSPWEYPAGTIEELPEDIQVPDGFLYEELNTFLYADSAIGRFIRDARAEPWFDDTVFVFVGDHGVHLRGRLTVPVEEYRVPAVFYCPKHVRPERFGAITSQIDIAPTVLGMLRDEYRSTFFGRDIRSVDEGLALMVYQKSRYAVVSGARFTLLAPRGDDETLSWVDGEWKPCIATVAHDRDARVAKGVLQTAEALLEAATYRAVDDT